MNQQEVPGWEGSIGPFRKDFGSPHVYARDVRSGAGSCVCSKDLGHRWHVQVAPGVGVPRDRRLVQSQRPSNADELAGSDYGWNPRKWEAGTDERPFYYVTPHQDGSATQTYMVNRAATGTDSILASSCYLADALEIVDALRCYHGQ